MLDWVRANILTIGVIALAVVYLIGVLIATVQGRESRGRRAIVNYINIRESSWATLATFLLGILISLAIGGLVWGIVVLVLVLVHPAGNSALLYLLQNAAGLVTGTVVGALFVFWPGFFTVRAGEKAFLTLFGIPFGRLGPGWGWVFPGFMTVNKEISAAMQDRTDAAEEYLTGDGLEIFVESEITVAVVDPLLVQGIQAASVRDYISARRKAAVRKYIGTLSASQSLRKAMNEDATIEDQVALFEDLRNFKGEITRNGPNTILGILNDELPAYGLRAQQVQVENVRFNDRLEASSERVFDEIAEALGLRKDALNKALNAKTLREALFRDLGLELNNLTNPEKLAQLRRDVAYALAAEGQGGYNYLDFGGQPPPGVIVTTPSTPSTPTGGNNGKRSSTLVPTNDNGRKGPTRH